MGLSKKCIIQFKQSYYRVNNFSEVVPMLSKGIINFNAKGSFLNYMDSWKDLMHFQGFGRFITHKLLMASNSQPYDSLFNHWYIQEDEHSFGPFSFIQMLEFFKQARIGLKTLIRHPTYKGWQKLEHAGIFELKSLEQVLSSPDIIRVITRRKLPRIRYENEVFLSSQGNLYRGVSWSVSSAGLGILTDQPTDLEFNDRVNVIIYSNNYHGAIQVKACVVGLQKEMNYGRLALVFGGENEVLNRYIDHRIPS